jgi:PEP-CTERM motif
MKLTLANVVRFAFLVLVCTAVSLSAPISGNLSITGAVRIGGDFADFFPLGAPTGDFNVEPTSTGFFTSVVDPGPSDDGDILDLDSGNAPVGVMFSLPNFLTFNLDPTVTFELQFIEDGAFPICPAGLPAACSVNQFNLVDTGSSVLAGFNVRGVVHSGSDVSTFIGAFSHVFSNTDIATLLAKVNAAGFIDTPFDADFQVTAIPEPTTIALAVVGLGMLGFSGWSKRLRRRS